MKYDAWRMFLLERGVSGVQTFRVVKRQLLPRFELDLAEIADHNYDAKIKSLFSKHGGDSKMQLQQLLYFVEVTKHKSINKAAESLFLTQPNCCLCKFG